MTRGMLATIVGCLAISICSSAWGNPIVVNGSFETPILPPPYFAKSVPALTNAPPGTIDVTTVPGWTYTYQGGGYGNALLWRVGYSDGFGSVTTAGEGQQFATLGGGAQDKTGIAGSGSLSQTISGFTIGANYVLGFKMAAEGPISGALSLTLSDDSSISSQTFTADPGGTPNYWMNWQTRQVTFTANSSDITINFSVTNQPFNVGLDDITLAVGPPTPTPAPLPASFWAGLLILGGIGVCGQFRKSAQRRC